MIFPESNLKIFVYSQAVDMRKSFTGLYALTKQELKEDPLSGSLFVFCNKSRTYMKVLYFDRSGFCIWSKRLEQGRFNIDRDGGKQELSWTDLKLVLEGIELKKVKKRKRFSLER